jgi:hypothetical protein
MPSPYTVLFAQCFVVPATQVWCNLMLNHPGERIARAWVKAFLAMSDATSHEGKSSR